MGDIKTEQIHATCVAIGDSGILLRGPSGSGKSDLALRLIDTGARLVADDRVDLSSVDGAVQAQAPDNLFGLLEVYGLGIMQVEARHLATVVLVCDLVSQDEVERIPEDRTVSYLGISLPCFSIAPFEPSSVKKVHLALGLAEGSIMRTDDAN